MTNQAKFGITRGGDVYVITFRGRKLLGHIGWLAGERTPLAAQVRAWWRKQMETDGPIEILDEDSDSLIEPPPSVSEGALVVGGNSVELMEELIA